jgi:hypothetical protein
LIVELSGKMLANLVIAARPWQVYRWPNGRGVLEGARLTHIGCDNR